MTRAIVPTEIPPLPESASAWLRSTRVGSMYHAHTGLGGTLCERIRLDRHKSEEVRNLGDMQFWGVCPRCLAKSRQA